MPAEEATEVTYRMINFAWCKLNAEYTLHIHKKMHKIWKIIVEIAQENDLFKFKKQKFDFQNQCTTYHMTMIETFCPFWNTTSDLICIAMYSCKG